MRAALVLYSLIRRDPGLRFWRAAARVISYSAATPSTPRLPNITAVRQYRFCDRHFLVTRMQTPQSVTSPQSRRVCPVAKRPSGCA
jgi:hypothetical protein